jgi:hypothetical protein
MVWILKNEIRKTYVSLWGWLIAIAKTRKHDFSETFTPNGSGYSVKMQRLK